MNLPNLQGRVDILKGLKQRFSEPWPVKIEDLARRTWSVCLRISIENITCITLKNITHIAYYSCHKEITQKATFECKRNYVENSTHASRSNTGTIGYSGADLASVLRFAVLFAAKRRRSDTISMTKDDFQNALKHVKASVDDSQLALCGLKRLSLD